MHTCVRAQSVFFLMIDIQERLLPAIFEKERVIQNSVRLLAAARDFEAPLIVTEQYPKGIGPMVPELAGLLPPGTPCLTKTAFSCCGAEGFNDAVNATGRETAVLFGIETHICVLSTAMDLLARGMKVVLAADACSSRTEANYALGLAAVRDCGGLVVPTETVVYQMMGEAGTPQFKALLPLFK